MILIAGAGLAGLSTAYHLRGREFRLIERESRPGGLCRTESRGFYRFDYGGHLLHLKKPESLALVKELLGDNLRLYARRSGILSQGVVTPYPFQAHLQGRPRAVVRDCLLGFIEAWTKKEKLQEPENFYDWVLAYFGEGFARHFFFPFNEKFFKLDLHELTPEWASWSIPRPTLTEVIDGALGCQERKFGYNVEFYYPVRGGIEELPRALASRLSRAVETGVELREVIVPEKRAVLSTGEVVKYDWLVSTIPLNWLLGMLRGAPPEIREAGQVLRSLSVLCVNLGISGPPLSDYHWLYLPDPWLSAHRIGFYSNFQESPPGRISLYLEITVPDSLKPGLEEMNELCERAKTEFLGLPLDKGGERQLELMEPLFIEPGYVIYNHYRERKLRGILEYLREQGILAIGRYGRWEYSTMEEALWQGKALAGELED